VTDLDMCEAGIGEFAIGAAGISPQGRA
jgi:hypothetical protein